MTPEIEREMREGLDSVTPGPWMVYDGCSWRRIGTAHGRRDDCAVLAPYRASDGHPDLYASRGNDVHANLEHIARCDPQTIRYLLDEIERLRKVEEQSNAFQDALEIADAGLQKVTEHDPKTPGLHFTNHAELLESAVGIAGLVREGIAPLVSKAGARFLTSRSRGNEE